MNGAGSSLTATDVSVTTDGGLGPAFGDAAIGAYNGFASPGDPTGGAMTLTDTTIATSGAAAVGVDTNSGGVTNISGGAVATSGQDAHAIFVSSAGSRVDLSGATTFATKETGRSGSMRSPAASSMRPGRSRSRPRAALGDDDRPSRLWRERRWGGSQINLAGPTTATTAGATAFGLYASAGGTITPPGGPSVTTSGLGATGLYASGAGSSVTVGGGATILTQGAMAPAAQADNGGLATLNGGSLTTSGNNLHALEVSGTGSRASLGGANSFSTSGLGSIGLSALGGGVINASGQTTVATAGSVSPSTGLPPMASTPMARVLRSTSRGGDHDNRRGRGRSLRQRCDGHGSRRGDCGFGTAGHRDRRLVSLWRWAQGAGSTIALNGPTK